jgi:ABC-2 type transport system ATP-binding protein
MPTSQSPGPAIRVQGLQKSFKELAVLRGVDFDVQRGSIFALLGANGAGKTTLVKILSTLLRADAGTASVNGFDVTREASNVRESLSLTGQFAAVDEILTGRENLVLVARLRHLDAPGVIADELVERFDFADAAGRKVATYSGGMRRRLDIAMSLIGNPSVIFLDEPLPDWTLRRASRCGGRSRSSLREARRCCSRRSTSTRPSSSPTGSRSSATDTSS